LSIQKNEICLLCNGIAHQVSNHTPGYTEALNFSIYECETCMSSFASPLSVDDSIYENIYKHINYIPGYNRYHLYAREILKQKNPLEYLSRQEESYWAVTHHLKEKKIIGSSLKILEVGCGLGYLTYALRKDGYNILGLDGSLEAISWAKKHYGTFYSNSTLRALKEKKESFDVIILNQIIEHIPDINKFISDAVSLLSTNGELVITTPNKSAYPNAQWETELPPVHLWWFGESSLRYLAKLHKCAVSFVNFDLFYNSFCRLKTPPTSLQSRKPIFNKQGEILVKQKLVNVGRVKRLLENLRILSTFRILRANVTYKERWRGKQGPICAAILIKEGVKQ